MGDFAATFKSEGWTPDGLVASNASMLYSEPGTLLSGQNLARGAVLGKITSGGKLVLSLSGASDGSQVPYGILVDDVNASAGDKPCLVYVRGDFQAQALTLGASHTLASIEAGLRDRGIFIVKTTGGV